MKHDPKFSVYTHPAGGWGSVQSLGRSLAREHVPFSGSRILTHQNKPDGFACVSCAWAKPAKPRPFEFCEEGAKATTWEITNRRCAPEFFAENTVSALASWSDHALEEKGRLTHPLRWDASTDKYVPIEWGQAFAEIGRELKGFDPEKVVFYSSGRASLEASYMYALFAHMYGNNNLPDSSNMCHESTSVGLPLSIGVPVGTITLDDFEKTDCILFFGHNTGVNAPRMLHQLQECAKRGVPIIVFNPLVERSHQRFTNPQNPVEMLVKPATQISSQYHQIKVGGDKAALMGLCKALFEADDAANATGSERVLDTAFINEHTHGFEEFEKSVREASWDELERRSGLTREVVGAAAAVYAQARNGMAAYGMGLTQQVGGVENVQMIVNLLLLRGNIGKPGAGVLPVRGHSNVQGQRTVGITEPCLGRIEIDEQQTGPQAVSMEDSTACIHGSPAWLSPPASICVRSPGSSLSLPRRRCRQIRKSTGMGGWRIIAGCGTRSSKPIPRCSATSMHGCFSRADFTVRWRRGIPNGKPKPARPISSSRKPSLATSIRFRAAASFSLPPSEVRASSTPLCTRLATGSEASPARAWCYS